ncbi:MAG: response regulator transcription factor, partial [Candidatus Eremiobacteraeota bacterium]|nr:response regulator transcription factor [Candidatus Eremiobacteraeota bacterium]
EYYRPERRREKLAGKPITVIVADDSRLFREMLVGILNLQSDIKIVAETKNGTETLEKVKELTPDVCLIDVKMPDLDGIKVTELIKTRYPEIKVILFTAYIDEDYIFSALEKGASGFLTKESPLEKVIEAVRTVYSGESMLDAISTSKLIREFLRLKEEPKIDRKKDEKILKQLTEREREVLGLIAQGMSNQEIANKLFISEHTVKTHVSNLLRKLKFSDRVQLVIFAFHEGIVDL